MVGIIGGIGKIVGAVSAQKTAKRAKRAERTRQLGIIRTTESRTRSLQREAQRALGRQRAGFAAAGVSATAGTPGLFTQASLFETIEEVTLLQETAFLELFASRQRQKAFSEQERLANIALAVNIAGVTASATPALGGAGGLDLGF